MKFVPERRTPPRSVQWAAVILAGLPLYDAIVAAGSLGMDGLLVGWQLRGVVTALFLAEAAGLLIGINLVRLLFAGLLLYDLATRAIGWFYLGAVLTSSAYALTSMLAPYLALTLCFVPSANRYFSRQKPTEESAAEPPRPHGIILKLGLFVIVALVASFFFKDRGYISPENRKARDRIFQEAYERQIVGNCRMLCASMNQYLLEHPSETKVNLSQLVGPNSYLTRLQPISGESYPTEFTRNGDITVKLRGGGRIIYNPNTGRSLRIPVLP